MLSYIALAAAVGILVGLARVLLPSLTAAYWMRRVERWERDNPE